MEVIGAKTIDGEKLNLSYPDQFNEIIDASGLLIMPALIDPHVHFRTPGHDYKENWETGAKAAISGGMTTVFDMPNNEPPCTTKERLEDKKKLIEKQLTRVNIPLKYHLYIGADKQAFDEIKKVKDDIIGIKIFMGSSTGSLLIDDDVSLETCFKIASEYDLLISVHAECECILQAKAKAISVTNDASLHPKIRDRSAAITATEKVIALASKYKNRLNILHISTKEELDLIRQAKNDGLPVTAETTNNHLFLNDEAYKKYNTLIQMNPPIRSKSDQRALWKAIDDGTIDMIGTDHAPHTLEEKQQPYGQAPSGIPGIETMLPLLLNAYHNKKMTLQRIVELTRYNIEDIFRLKPNDDFVLIDLNEEHKVEAHTLKTKCGWSPYEGWLLRGWPVYTIINGRIFHSETAKECNK